MRVLTKSRFKLGLECQNKLYFTNKDAYANTKEEDSFLEALAQGGFQVEELARMMHPGGELITGNDGDYEVLWSRTRDILKNDKATIFEAAMLYDGLFVRSDIIVKHDATIDLIEVKAKSFDSTEAHIFIGAKGGLKSEWKAYLFDVAFQKYVIQQNYPDHTIKSYLMLADTSKTASVDGLNQMFRVTRTADHRTGIQVLADSIDDLGTPVLTKIDVSEIVAAIEDGAYKIDPKLSFKEAVAQYKINYQEDKYANWPTSYSACNHCEFKTSKTENAEGLDSGFEYCFSKQHGWNAPDFEKPNIFEIGGLNYRRGIEMFENNKFFMSDLVKADINFKEESGKLSSTERQWLQIKKAVNDDPSVFIDKTGLKNTMAGWKFPLHFIDFETSASALPFHKGRRPYEQIAFQFSHHSYHKNGDIVHANEFLNVEAGVFPNFEFIRALKNALDSDTGSIFKYSNHENTILNAIYQQLETSEETDKKELMDFIRSISHSTKNSDTKWKGPRDMVDLLEVIKDFYYHPLTKGSNSIKAVLPAILHTSDVLRSKYSKALGAINLSSRNFTDDHVWLAEEGNEVISPYKSLPPIFEHWTAEAIEKSLSEMESISDGGAALTAYGKLQYTNMSVQEITEIKQALLKYCELDTLAMVMIYEHFLELLAT